MGLVGGALEMQPTGEKKKKKNRKPVRLGRKDRGLQDGDGERESERARLGGHDAENNEQNHKRSGKPSKTPRRMRTAQ